MVKQSNKFKSIKWSRNKNSVQTGRTSGQNIETSFQNIENKRSKTFSSKLTKNRKVVKTIEQVVLENQAICQQVETVSNAF